jgi:tRNA nucleotidyltransferase (CCA-adding enzyme)
MEIYAVGGCLRDELLGLPVKDHDWVVVGATPQLMLEAGFKPVGKDFPVFLHPVTHEEYALARTERKTAAGYHGFVFHTDPSVTLIEDLARRDFTINAIARDKHGVLIDPFEGQRDLRAGIFRHVSPAFVEDPVRILRMARFMARFESFTIAPETLALCVQMVAAGEVDALIPERVWQELSRGLMETMPSRMISTLEHCGALQRIVPELATLEDIQLRTSSTTSVDLLTHTKRVIDLAAQMNTAASQCATPQ